MPSTAPSATASVAGDELASSTVETAQSTLPVAGLGDRRDLGDRVVLDLLAERPGDVLALAADRRGGADARPRAPSRRYSPASVMNVPALAAKPPAGATQTMIGTLASRSVPTMSFVEVRQPPGVLSLMTTAAAPSRSARGDPVGEVARPCPGRRCRSSAAR